MTPTPNELADLEKIATALELAIGYPALVAKGVGNMPILKDRAQDDCRIIGEALAILSRLETALSSPPAIDLEGLKREVWSKVGMAGDPEMVLDRVLNYLAATGKLGGDDRKGPFICGVGGKEVYPRIYEMVTVCPAYGSDATYFYRLEKMEEGE